MGEFHQWLITEGIEHGERDRRVRQARIIEVGGTRVMRS